MKEKRKKIMQIYSHEGPLLITASDGLWYTQFEINNLYVISILHMPSRKQVYFSHTHKGLHDAGRVCDCPNRSKVSQSFFAWQNVSPH